MKSANRKSPWYLREALLRAGSDVYCTDGQGCTKLYNYPTYAWPRRCCTQRLYASNSHHGEFELTATTKDKFRSAKFFFQDVAFVCNQQDRVTALTVVGENRRLNANRRYPILDMATVERIGLKVAESRRGAPLISIRVFSAVFRAAAESSFWLVQPRRTRSAHRRVYRVLEASVRPEVCSSETPAMQHLPGCVQSVPRLHRPAAAPCPDLPHKQQSRRAWNPE
jgi:hypothetical protein